MRFSSDIIRVHRLVNALIHTATWIARNNVPLNKTRNAFIVQYFSVFHIFHICLTLTERLPNLNPTTATENVKVVTAVCCRAAVHTINNTRHAFMHFVSGRQRTTCSVSVLFSAHSKRTRVNFSSVFNVYRIQWVYTPYSSAPPVSFLHTHTHVHPMRLISIGNSHRCDIHIHDSDTREMHAKKLDLFILSRDSEPIVGWVREPANEWLNERQWDSVRGIMHVS